MAYADDNGGRYDYVWPCSTRYVTQEYGSWAMGAGHTGMDIGCSMGSPIWACKAGTVCWVQYWNTSMGTSGNASYGNIVAIDHGDNIITYYAHLSRITTSNGARVSQGQIIGYSGSTGNVTGPHLHLEARRNGGRINPRDILEKTITATPAPAPTPTTNNNDEFVVSGPVGSIGSYTPSANSSSSTVEITTVDTTISGRRGRRDIDLFGSTVIKSGPEIIIGTGTNNYLPVVEDGITLQRPRSGSPATLKFKIINDKNIKIGCGNSVSFKWNSTKMFYGYIFSIKASNRNELDITAYDQLRYLKNQNSYVFSKKTMTDIVKKLCQDNGLNVGTIVDTKKKITLGIGEKSGLDWIADAAAETAGTDGKSKSGSEYVVYDKFGKVTMSEMVPYKKKGNKYVKGLIGSCIVDNSEISNFNWEQTIDDQSATSTQLKLAYDDNTTGKRHIFEYNNESAQKKFGTLTLYSNKAAWSNASNRKSYKVIWEAKWLDASRRYSAKGVTGATDVRGGWYVPVIVDMGLSSMKSCTFMLVEDCKHIFSKGQHTMDLTLRGGKYDV